MTSATVYINWGRFVVECPCGDAIEVQPGQKTGECIKHHPLELEWHPDTAKAMAALTERTADRRMNWFPADHPVAVANRQPHGQTPDDLRREAAAGEKADADHIAAQRAQLFQMASELGLTAEDMINALKGS